MKTIKHWLLTIALLLCSTSLLAHDFEVGGIYYQIVSSTDLTVEVSYKGSSYDYYSNEYSGSVTIPESVTYNGITYSVTSIGSSAFRSCSGLTSVTIPNSVTSIGTNAFSGCHGLTSVHISDIAAWCKIDFGDFFSNPLSYAEHLFLDGEEIKDLVIPNSVTSIGHHAFSGCSGLTSVVIPNSVTSIGENAFCNCDGLTSVVIPNSVTSIGGNAFDGSSGLKEVHISDIAAWCKIDFATSYSNPLYRAKHLFLDGEEIKDLVIPNSVTSIGDYAFYGCSGLTSVTIPNSVTSIGNNAFYGCSGLTSVHISDIAAWCKIDFATSHSNPLSYAEHLFLDGEEIKDLVIPNSVTSIGDYAFSGCSRLTSISIPNSVTSIGSGAFSGCSGLTSISIPNSVTSIEERVFSGCSGLTSISIPNSVTCIGEYAFEDCSGLTSISIPNSVTSIGERVFYDCYRLTSISIPNSVTSIEDYAFYGCSGLTSISIPNSVTSIGYYAFYGCSGLTSISIPNSVTSIGDRAFYGCSGLTSISIPNSVTSIGYYAFYGCVNLTQIICHATTPPIVDSYALYYIDKSKCTLLIPEGTKSLYKAAHEWKDFLQVETIPVPKLFALIDGETYDNNEEQVMDTITYTRTFNNTEWQALYLPFSMNYSDWSEDFDVAKINNVHQFDENGDDVFDRTVLEGIKVKSGTLKPNHPYMIRAKSTGTKTITVENATLMPAEENSIDCSSVEREYVFTGTYTGVDGETMVENMYYAMSGGGVKYSTNTSVSLKPFRWYMQIKDRDGQVINDIVEAKVIVRGEEDWDVTGIEDVKTESGKFVIYSIGGTLVRNVKADNINQATEGLSAGMYIINGKKHFIK